MEVRCFASDPQGVEQVAVVVDVGVLADEAEVTAATGTITTSITTTITTMAAAAERTRTRTRTSTSTGTSIGSATAVIFGKAGIVFNELDLRGQFGRILKQESVSGQHFGIEWIVMRQNAVAEAKGL